MFTHGYALCTCHYRSTQVDLAPCQPSAFGYRGRQHNPLWHKLLTSTGDFFYAQGSPATNIPLTISPSGYGSRLWHAVAVAGQRLSGRHSVVTLPCRYLCCLVVAGLVDGSPHQELLYISNCSCKENSTI